MPDTIFVSTAVSVTADLLNDSLVENSISGQLIDQYSISRTDGTRIEVLVFEKHYMRADNRLTLTVTIDDFEGKTRVHFVGGGGGEGIFRFDWGAANSFEGSLLEALSEHIIQL